MRYHLALTLTLAVVPLAGAAAETPVDFSRDVRPILSENCFACHGADPGKRKANLRLDVVEGATKPAKSGAIAVVAGKPEQSELVKRITTADADDRMPPPDSNKHLTPDQVEILKRWVARGGEYKQHWSFVAPVRPPVPESADAKWARNPIDRFILARLESERLKPSPEADKVTLLRRLHLNLTGLPPTPQEVDAFIADSSPNAYDKAVDRLLASPHYGERWARHWLDAARYADSDGFEKDKSRQVFFYRDYVINAFNRDLPYNQFVIDQLAGDLLPNATQEQVVATGFLRNSMVNEEGGVDPEQFRMDAMFDRMDAIGKSVLGLTIQCAQCHTHKYDPLTQEEYYRLFAFINNDYEAQRVVYTPDEQMKVADLTRQMREVEATLRGRTPEWQDRMARWEESVKADEQPDWQVLKVEYEGENDERYLPQKDGSFLAQGYAPTKHTPKFQFKTNQSGITGFRLELFPDANLPCGGPGRSFKGTCALTEFMVDVAPADQPAKKKRLKVVEATADIETPEAELEPNFYDKSKDRRVTGPVKFAIDGDGKTAWGIDAGPGRRNVARKAVFRLEKPIEVEAGKEVVVTLSLQQNHGGWNSDDHMNNNLGRFRLSATTAPAERVKADPLPKRVRDILAIPQDRRTEQQTAEVFGYWRTTVGEWKDENATIDELWKQWPVGSTSLTLMARNEPRETHMLDRGDWLKPTRTVTAGVPAFLHPLNQNGERSASAVSSTAVASASGGAGAALADHDAPPATRLTFARWLADRRAPTTARVFVNRVWQAYFGTGLVATPEDFGLQGEAPSHPELLDWLAVEFMDHGWSVKHLHRLIVTSSAYRQSSKVTRDLLAKDPYNRLLARGPRFRVEGEIVRDVALAASGLLNDRVGGRSVMPPAPAFLFQPPASYAPFPWVDETGADKYRRALYTFRRRSTPYPALQTFDAPNGDTSCVRRSRSNSPLQALVTLNEPIFVDCARALAKKVLAEGGKTDDERIAYAFRRVLARAPTDAERRELLDLLKKQQQRFADGWLNPVEVATGEARTAKADELPPGITPTQWGAYTVVARVLLNLDETITKE
jgi:mono/diheme cytochrome c family protein